MSACSGVAVCDSLTAWVTAPVAEAAPGDSPEFVSRLRAGDRAAFEELVRRTSRLIFAHLYLETGDPHRAEDLLQETLLTAFRSLGKLTEPKAFRTWLLTIAQNVLTDAIRRESRQKRAGPVQRGTAALAHVEDKSPRPEERAWQIFREVKRPGRGGCPSRPANHRSAPALRWPSTPRRCHRPNACPGP